MTLATTKGGSFMLVAHVSDLHLGRQGPGDPHGAERLNSFRHAMATLAQAQADVLVVAGDTFDSPQVEQAIVEEAGKILAGVMNDKRDAVPVVVIPGNHDPADADKLWSAFRKSLGPAANVRLALAPEIIELAGGALLIEAYPCPARFSAAPPWERRLPIGNVTASAVRVVVAHGTLQGGPVPEGETDAYPFTQADLEALGADYVALGHFHGLYPAWGVGDECHRSFCYCGTHEPDQFGGDAGYAVLATVGAGQRTHLRRVKIGRRHWRLIQLSGPADLAKVERLEEQIKTDNDPARYVIRLKVAGAAAWTATEVERLDRLEGTLRAVGAQLERRGNIRTRVDAQSLDLHGLPSGAVREALLALRNDIGLTTDDNRREVLAAALQVGWEKLQESIET